MKSTVDPNSEEAKALKAIVKSAKQLGWSMAMDSRKEREHNIFEGLVIGKMSFINEVLGKEKENYEILTDEK